MDKTIDEMNVVEQNQSRAGPTQAKTSLFRHEQVVIDEIRHHIQSEGIGKLVSNVTIHDEATGSYFECDIILVATSGIYIVELKHWSGHTTVAPYQWIRNHTNHIQSPHKQIITNVRSSRECTNIDLGRTPTCGLSLS